MERAAPTGGVCLFRLLEKRGSQAKVMFTVEGKK